MLAEQYHFRFMAYDSVALGCALGLRTSTRFTLLPRVFIAKRIQLVVLASTRPKQPHIPRKVLVLLLGDANTVLQGGPGAGRGRYPASKGKARHWAGFGTTG